MNTYIIYEINLWSYKQNYDFASGNFLFGAFKLARHADFGKYKCSRYGIGFNACTSFSLSDGSGFAKNVVMFGADTGSSVHVDNRKNIYFNSWLRSNGRVR